ncbi:MAG: hypothetical protein ACLPQ0_11795 [Candidatus Binatus sp.]
MKAVLPENEPDRLSALRHCPIRDTQPNDAFDPRLSFACRLKDADIVETVANVVLNIFANYLNHAPRSVVDFTNLEPGSE